jgi:hypothetical protein
LYREVAKRIHPDLTTDPVERHRRQQLMAAANLAYEQGDEARLRKILQDYESSPEVVQGEGTAAELVRAIRKIAQARNRIIEIGTEAELLIQSDLYKLMQKAEEAKEQGRDLPSLFGRNVGNVQSVTIIEKTGERSVCPRIFSLGERSSMRKVVFVCAIFCAVGAKAEPSASVQYLMGESVSLFEWGMFRLQSRAERFHWDRDVDLLQGHSAKVDYDWQKNELRIEITAYPRYRNLQKTTAKEVCGSLMRQVKGQFGVTPGTEFLREILGVGTFFHHQYFERSNAPDKLDADLEAITTLEVGVYASKTDQAPFQNLVSCSSELVKPEVRFFTTSEQR